jgi:hypothetical protein
MREGRLLVLFSESGISQITWVLPFVLATTHKKTFEEHATPHFSTSFQNIFNKVKDRLN